MLDNASFRCFKLTFAAKVGLELGEHTEHVEEGLAGRHAGIDRLPGCLERDPRSRSSWTMSCRSRMLRASRSTGVTTRVPPGRRKSNRTSSSVSAAASRAAHLFGRDHV